MDCTMTDKQILEHYREANPHVSLRVAKELHRLELKFRHVGVAARRREQQAREAEQLRLNRLCEWKRRVEDEA